MNLEDILLFLSDAPGSTMRDVFESSDRNEDLSEVAAKINEMIAGGLLESVYSKGKQRYSLTESGNAELLSILGE